MAQQPFKADQGVLSGGLNVLAAVGAYRLTYMVDPIFGNDANDGKSWLTPFATPQAAVDQFIADKHALVTQVGAINTAPVDYTGISELYGQNGLILLAAGDYAPTALNIPVIDIPEWTADGAATGGGWGLTIMGVPGNGRALITGTGVLGESTDNLIQINGARGVRLLNLCFNRLLKTAATHDILITDNAAHSMDSQYIEIADCKFLPDVVADDEASPAAIGVNGAKFVDIHDCKFYRRGAGAIGARGIILNLSATGNIQEIDIHDNEFEALESGAIQYLAAADIQNAKVYRNTFIQVGKAIGAGNIAMANAIDLDAGKAEEYWMKIFDNYFLGAAWAALDAAGATDAIYDVVAGALVDSSVDYAGNDASNRLIS